MKKFAALDRGLVWRGMVFIKTGGVLFLKLRGKRGMFFYWAGYWRGISIVGDLTCQNLQSK
jgi:hypothetical protein